MSIIYMFETLQFINKTNPKLVEEIVSKCDAVEIPLKEGKLTYFKLKKEETQDVSNKSN